MKRLCGLGAALGVAVPGWAWAGTPASAELHWTRQAGAKGCLSQAQLQTQVEARLGRRVFTKRKGDVAVHGRARGSSGAWEVLLELRDRRGGQLGTRTLRSEADDCSALDDSLALVVAIMVDLTREELPQADPPPPRRPLRLPREAHAPREPWQFSVRAEALVGLGVIPGWSFGTRLGFGVEPPTFWLTEVEGTWWFPTEVPRDQRSTGFTMQALGLVVCPLQLGSKPILYGCISQQVGRIQAEGQGYYRDAAVSRIVYDLGLRARGLLPLWGPLAAFGSLSLEIPLSRDRFVDQDARGRVHEVYRRPLVAGAGSVGLELDF